MSCSTWYFRDMAIQGFLNLDVILVIFANFFSGVWDTFQDTRDPPIRTS